MPAPAPKGPADRSVPGSPHFPPSRALPRAAGPSSPPHDPAAEAPPRAEHGGGLQPLMQRDAPLPYSASHGQNPERSQLQKRTKRRALQRKGPGVALRPQGAQGGQRLYRDADTPRSEHRGPAPLPPAAAPHARAHSRPGMPSQMPQSNQPSPRCTCRRLPPRCPLLPRSAADGPPGPGKGQRARCGGEPGRPSQPRPRPRAADPQDLSEWREALTRRGRQQARAGPAPGACAAGLAQSSRRLPVSTLSRPGLPVQRPSHWSGSHART